MKLTAFTLGASLAVGLALISGQALAQSPPHAHERAGSHQVDTHQHSHGATADGHDHGHGYAGEGRVVAKAALATEPETLQAGVPATLKFRLTDGMGRPLDKLIVHHGRKLHVVIVSAEMEVLGHVHPQDFDDTIVGGEASVRFTFPRGGRYIVAADMMTDLGPYAEQFIVNVTGEAAGGGTRAAAAAKVAVADFESGDRYTAAVILLGADKADGYEVSLAGPDRIQATKPVS